MAALSAEDKAAATKLGKEAVKIDDLNGVNIYIGGNADENDDNGNYTDDDYNGDSADIDDNDAERKIFNPLVKVKADEYSKYRMFRYFLFNPLEESI